jgi:uncharacterized protein (DUF362 family)
MQTGSGEMPVPVALAHCQDYDPVGLESATDSLFQAIGFHPTPDTRILVKPNLIAVRGGSLACSHPQVVRAVCRWLLDHDVQVTVGDSPAFGAAPTVARHIGLTEALAGLHLPVANLGHPVPLKFSFGGAIGVSRTALESDLILNVPKLKAHSQMRVTGAVKNLFGCVSGMRKAMAHSKYGDKGNKFESMIVEIVEALPPVTSLMDGITAMHRTGPMGGDSYPLGLLGACTNPVALDTAIYGILGTSPEAVALWREAICRNLPGARPEEISYPLEQPEAFDGSGFLLPELSPVTFHPLRLAKSAVKRTLLRLRR